MASLHTDNLHATCGQHKHARRNRTGETAAPVFGGNSGRPEKVAFGNPTTAKWAHGMRRLSLIYVASGFSRKAVAVAVTDIYTSRQVGKSASRQVGKSASRQVRKSASRQVRKFANPQVREPANPRTRKPAIWTQSALSASTGLMRQARDVG